MDVFSIDRVTQQSEELCLEWGGEFRGKLCLSLEFDQGDIKICIYGNARRIGRIDKVCMDFGASCYTIIEAGIGRIKLCISQIEWEDGLPRCFRIKLKLYAGWLGNTTLARHKICLFGILGSMRGETDFAINSSAGNDDIVVIPVIEAEDNANTCC